MFIIEFNDFLSIMTLDLCLLAAEPSNSDDNVTHEEHPQKKKKKKKNKEVEGEPGWCVWREYTSIQSMAFSHLVFLFYYDVIV